jgi:hypothetical protein
MSPVFFPIEEPFVQLNPPFARGAQKPIPAGSTCIAATMATADGRIFFLIGINADGETDVYKLAQMTPAGVFSYAPYSVTTYNNEVPFLMNVSGNCHVVARISATQVRYYATGNPITSDNESTTFTVSELTASSVLGRPTATSGAFVLPAISYPSGTEATVYAILFDTTGLLSVTTCQSLTGLTGTWTVTKPMACLFSAWGHALVYWQQALPSVASAQWGIYGCAVNFTTGTILAAVRALATPDLFGSQALDDNWSVTSDTGPAQNSVCAEMQSAGSILIGAPIFDGAQRFVVLAQVTMDNTGEILPFAALDANLPRINRPNVSGGFSLTSNIHGQFWFVSKVLETFPDPAGIYVARFTFPGNVLTGAGNAFIADSEFQTGDTAVYAEETTPLGTIAIFSNTTAVVGPDSYINPVQLFQIQDLPVFGCYLTMQMINDEFKQGNALSGYRGLEVFDETNAAVTLPSEPISFSDFCNKKLLPSTPAVDDIGYAGRSLTFESAGVLRFIDWSFSEKEPVVEIARGIEGDRVVICTIKSIKVFVPAAWAPLRSAVIPNTELGITFGTVSLEAEVEVELSINAPDEGMTMIIAGVRYTGFSISGDKVKLRSSSLTTDQINTLLEAGPLSVNAEVIWP